ncbi:hypothetical protein R2A130_0341 [Ahrensia sp. R2A130]|nr:hypothetical protein R2A130_0341 [Ahrensia sp. R2A130]
MCFGFALAASGMASSAAGKGSISRPRAGKRERHTHIASRQNAR